MKYLTNYYAMAVLSVVFLTSQATYLDYIHKPIILTLPYYPSSIMLIPSDGTAVVAPRNSNSMNMYLASNESGNQDASLALCEIRNNLRPGTSPSLPSGRAPELVTINKEKDQPNPLYNARIELMTMLNKIPVVVTQELPSTIFSIETIVTDTHHILQATPVLNDAQGNPCAGIGALAAGSTALKDNDVNRYIFAALKEHNGGCNNANSDIAVVKYDKNILTSVVKEPDGTEKTVETPEYFFNVLDASTGASQGNKAVAVVNDALRIHGCPVSCFSVVDLCWNPYVERLYIALQVTNGYDCTPEQGAVALLVGHLDEQQRLCLNPCAPQDLFVGNDKMVGAYGPGVSVSLHKLRSMITSTGVPYLLVVGGVGEPDQTNKNLISLPLVNRITFHSKRDAEEARLLDPEKDKEKIAEISMRTRLLVIDDPLQGTIASKQAAPQCRYTMTWRGVKLVGRCLDACAQTLQEMPTVYDRATQVGAGRELPHAITDIQTIDDAVFVTVAQEGAGQHPGIFHSQAILDGSGKIVAWTPWQRIGGVFEGVRALMMNREQYFFAYLKANEPEIVCSVNLVIPKDKKNDNPEKQGDLADLVEAVLPPDSGGVQGLFDFPSSVLGVDSAPKISMLVATGYKKVVLIESGSDDASGIFNGYKEGFTQNAFLCDDTIAIQEKSESSEKLPRVIVITGGVLEQLGSITDATIATDGDQSWLIVSSVQGVAVLSYQDGSGWKNDPGLLPGFAGITQPMSFKRFGTYKYVKKVFGDGAYLYILTHKTLERVALTPENICHNAESSIVIARAENFGKAFFDGGVSGPLAVVATSQGLWRNGDGTDVRVDNAVTMSWTEIILPCAKKSINSLFFVSPTGIKNGFGHQGNIYVSIGSLLDNETSIYRICVGDVFSEGITAEAIQCVPDYIFMNKDFPFLLFNNFRDHFATNGIHCFTARSGHMRENPFLHLASPYHIKTLMVKEAVPYEVPLNSGKKAKNITALVQNSATGNWLIAGDFGLRIHN